MQPITYLVIPCYNEEAVLLETAEQLHQKVSNMIQAELIDENSKIVFVDDGSNDQTWNIIKTLYQTNKIFNGLHLSRNRGHQNALLAGLLWAKDYADITISLDADLQDDIQVLDQFILCYLKGNDIVYGVRKTRTTDSWFKRNTALAFYKLQNLCGIESVYNHADYRLMSKRAVEALEEFKEVNLFLRGMVPMVGYPSCSVEYDRNKRFAGESKYPFKKMLRFAFDGITSFSVKPIRFIMGFGILIFFISMSVIVYSIICKTFGFTVDGWTFIVCSIWMLGGIQLLGIGIIGEYIGKVYMESKKRPRYILEEILHETMDSTISK